MKSGRINIQSNSSSVPSNMKSSVLIKPLHYPAPFPTNIETFSYIYGYSVAGVEPTTTTEVTNTVPRTITITKNNEVLANVNCLDLAKSVINFRKTQTYTTYFQFRQEYTRQYNPNHLLVVVGYSTQSGHYTNRLLLIIRISDGVVVDRLSYNYFDKVYVDPLSHIQVEMFNIANSSTQKRYRFTLVDTLPNNQNIRTILFERDLENYNLNRIVSIGTSRERSYYIDNFRNLCKLSGERVLTLDANEEFHYRHPDDRLSLKLYGGRVRLINVDNTSEIVCPPNFLISEDFKVIYNNSEIRTIHGIRTTNYTGLSYQYSFGGSWAMVDEVKKVYRHNQNLILIT